MARVMKLTLDGREWCCVASELSDLTIKEARAIKEHTGMRIPEWERAVTRDLHTMDADTFLALAYLVQNRSGTTFDWTSLDNMSALTLVQSFSLVDEPDASTEESGPVVDIVLASVDIQEAEPPPVEMKRTTNSAKSKRAAATPA